MIGSLYGLKIIEDEYMLNYYTEEVLRTWKERLLSFDWFTKYKTVNKSKPKEEVLKFEDKLVMHPEIAKKLKNEFERVENGI